MREEKGKTGKYEREKKNYSEGEREAKIGWETGKEGGNGERRERSTSCGADMNTLLLGKIIIIIIIMTAGMAKGITGVRHTNITLVHDSFHTFSLPSSP